MTYWDTEPWEITTFADSLAEDLQETVERLFHQSVTHEQVATHQNIAQLRDSFSEKLKIAMTNRPTWTREDLEAATTAHIEQQVQDAQLECKETILRLKNRRDIQLQAVETYVRGRA